MLVYQRVTIYYKEFHPKTHLICDFCWPSEWWSSLVKPSTGKITPPRPEVG